MLIYQTRKEKGGKGRREGGGGKSPKEKETPENKSNRKKP